ncbi:hypothetical protein VAR608DRAFT_2731 [Variovorax sp. HW608]|nr:hypothetical protein VAR608DRAFT_2731 [Variovorax sp. HW608]
MDDFFRSPDNGLPSNPVNRRFLRKLFESAATRLGLACDEAFASSDGGLMDVAAAMEALSLPCSVEGWAQSTIADISAVSGAGRFPDLDSRCLVIGWGMPPSLLNYIDGSGAVFIDLEIDPIRFTAHLKFCARTNDRSTEEALRKLRIDDAHSWNDAAALMGYFARRGGRSLFDASVSVGLFVGQTSVDLALVENGRLVRPVDAIDRVRDLASSVDLLVVKRHPYEPGGAHLAELVRDIPNALWTNENIYALLCADNLSFVSGLSSGTLREAEFFLKPAHHLIEADRNNPRRLPRSCSPWYSMPATIASIETMTEVCVSQGFLDRAVRVFFPRRADLAPPSDGFREDALDHAFGFRWGLDGAQQGLPVLPRLELDRGLGASESVPATAWLGEGWSTPEPWGVWSQGELASVIVLLESQAGALAASEIQLTGQLFTPQGHLPELLVSIDGGPAWRPEVRRTAEDEGAVTLSVPWPKASDRSVLVVNLHIRNPISPLDAGMSEDSRRLGFGLRRLGIEKLAVNRAARVGAGGSCRAQSLQHMETHCNSTADMA